MANEIVSEYNDMGGWPFPERAFGVKGLPVIRNRVTVSGLLWAALESAGQPMRALCISSQVLVGCGLGPR
jgi:hypothetical protein